MTLTTVVLTLVRNIMLVGLFESHIVLGYRASMANIQSIPCEMVTSRESSWYIIMKCKMMPCGGNPTIGV